MSCSYLQPAEASEPHRLLPFLFSPPRSRLSPAIIYHFLTYTFDLCPSFLDQLQPFDGTTSLGTNSGHAHITGTRSRQSSTLNEEPRQTSIPSTQNAEASQLTQKGHPFLSLEIFRKPLAAQSSFQRHTKLAQKLSGKASTRNPRPKTPSQQARRPPTAPTITGYRPLHRSTPTPRLLAFLLHGKGKLR